MADIYKIAESWMGAWVHNGPGIKYNQIDLIYGKDNKEYTVTERKNNYWLKIGDNRWVCDRDSNDMIIMKKISTTDAKKVENNNSETTTTDDDMTTDEEQAYMDPNTLSEDLIIIGSAEDQSSVEDVYAQTIENNFSISNMRGIFGMPYQFMASSDTRLNTKTDAIGRKYAKEIVANMPLLLITPGKPVFLSQYSKEGRSGIIKQFIGLATDSFSSDLNDIIFNEKFGKYYTLEYDFVEYFKYVNAMCRIAARFMNLQDEVIDGTPLDEYEWSQNVNKNFNKLFSTYNGCTAWYCNSDTNISDTFSNGTTESAIMSRINSLSDAGRELNFILGTVKSETGLEFDKFTSMGNLTGNMEVTEEFIDKTLGSTSGIGGLFKTITNSAQTLVAGGKLVFPEIWSDSSFSRSYDIELKLVSPDSDNLSIYLNIIVPLLHLLALVLPREAVKTHGYMSPFLVRGFYKGLFNVDMGIITSMNFTKGKESAWNVDGLPTTVDVSFTIKDLYNDMYMTSMDDMKYNMMNNIILMDYIGNLCGININQTDIKRGIDMYLMQNVKNRITDTWRLNIIRNIDQWITNKQQSIFGAFR